MNQTIIMDNQLAKTQSTQPFDSAEQDLLSQFIESLNTVEKKAYLIAKDHLGTTFNLAKSNAFLKWKKEKGL